MIYFSYVHSVLSYGIIFWGNIFYSNCIFNIQKRVCMGSGRRVSCRDLFRQLNILSLQSQYIFSLLFFVLRTGINFHPIHRFKVSVQETNEQI